MRVALVFMHPFSESMGSVVRIRQLALSMGRSGVESYIFTPYERSFDMAPNVHVVSATPMLSLPGLSKALYQLTRTLYYSRFFPDLFSNSHIQSGRIVNRLAMEIARKLTKLGIDIIQIEQDAALPLGIYLKKETNLPLVVDVHNISSEELVASGILERKSENYLSMQKRTQQLLGATDHTVVVSDAMRDYIVKNYGMDQRRITVVPPGGKVSSRKKPVSQRAKPIKIAYAGLVAYRERVDLFIESMLFAKSREGNLRFYVTNKGEALKDIKKLAEKIQVAPSYFWYNNYEMVDEFLSTCHVGVLPSSRDTARKMGTPAKLFSYLSAGLPVVANDIGGWSELIRNERVGVLTSDDPKDFGEAVTSLVNDPDTMQEYGSNGLDLVRTKFNWDSSASRLTSVYDKLAS
ncbi:MAG: glycosyltransferase family 4 protein [Candidatus Bathyarchaeia archaeon]